MKKYCMIEKMRQMIAGLLFVVILVFSPKIIFAAENYIESGGLNHAEILAEANDFFRQASELNDQQAAHPLYQKALIRFEKLASDGIKNGKLYYNIGNTYFRLDDLGRAIVNYQRARKLIPNDDNLLQNLAYAKSLQPDKIEKKQAEQIQKTVLFWHYDLSMKIRLMGLAVFNLLFWGLLAVNIFKAVVGRWPIIISFIFCLMLGGSLAYEMTLGSKVEGVLVSSEVIARKGDGQSYKPSFQAPLHAGLDFELLENRGDWLHIKLPDGRKCWIPANSAEII